MSYHRFNDDFGSFEVFLHADKSYYWWACFPACLPDGDAIGPFETYQEAFDDALMNYE
tara:strand:+ start:912 stop:1085 length:174 start_codon:yes stop_codon:yes gene_type:complete